MTERDEWANLGFTRDEAVAWRAAGFSPEDAAGWWDVTVGDPDEAARWRDAGFSLRRAKEWRFEGFTPDEAEALCDGGYTAEGAGGEWWETGVDPLELIALRCAKNVCRF